MRVDILGATGPGGLVGSLSSVAPSSSSFDAAPAQLPTITPFQHSISYGHRDIFPENIPPYSLTWPYHNIIVLNGHKVSGPGLEVAS